MSKTCCRVTPVNGYDIPALEQWLEGMASKGLLFSMTAGPLTLFQQDTPQALQFHLEPARDKTYDDDPELNALYEGAGWRYLGIFRKNYYVFATENREAQAHTDPDTLAYVLNRFFKQKLLGGIGLLLGNFFLLAFFRPNSLSNLLYWLRWFPVETLYARNVIPFALSLTGLALADLSWLLGLIRLRKHRIEVLSGETPPRPRRSGGWLLAVSILILLPVGAQLFVYFFGMDYDPYPLEGSGFVTLSEIEGVDFPLSGDQFYNMDYISHGDTPLGPEHWYFQQYGSFRHDDNSVSLNKVPHLEIRITRYLLPFIAVQRMDELSRTHDYDYSLGGYEKLTSGLGLDQVLASCGETGMSLILRRGNTVLQAEYRGDKDLTEYLDRFAQMMEGL